jgi:NAD(P)-dependent dehydrogenase (short-subunit alcohol dehydrogenase family)
MKPQSSQPVAVITGASQGIGACLVVGYRRLGYAVVANSRNMAPSHDAMVLAVARISHSPGVGKRLVNAALITGVNLRGFSKFPVLRCPMLSIGNGGHLVNISTSLVDHAGSALPSALAPLTKGGLNAVTKELAIEYAKHHVDGGQSAGR